LRRQIKNNTSAEISKQNTSKKLLRLIDDEDDMIKSPTNYYINNHISSMKELDNRKDTLDLSPENKYY
jgi:hypothetical protein